ncbi:MAG: iron ABC transporter permease [Clostridiales bacterium]|nr:iron ABC transporter permease [Clostridiales bacterium]
MKENTFSKDHTKRTLLLLALLLAAVFTASFLFGRYSVSLSDTVRILVRRLLEHIEKMATALFGEGASFLPETKPWAEQTEAVVINIRLPRILAAAMVGACLGAAGAAYQGVFQNPMASPDVLGASSGAGFGAALAILLGASARSITLLAFVMSLLTVVLVYLISLRAQGSRVMSLILGGIMLSSLFSAGTSYIKLVADPNDRLPAITYWLMGSLSGIRLSDLAAAAVPMLIGTAVLLLLRWRINILTFGEEEARSLGVNTNLLRLAVIVSATLITAAGISVSGLIGWVGLVIPHFARRLVGSNFRQLLPASMLLGAAFLLVADNLSRNLLAVEIPIGILTAFVGAPFFIHLLLQREKTL